MALQHPSRPPRRLSVAQALPSCWTWPSSLGRSLWAQSCTSRLSLPWPIRYPASLEMTKMRFKGNSTYFVLTILVFSASILLSFGASNVNDVALHDCVAGSKALCSNKMSWRVLLKSIQRIAFVIGTRHRGWSVLLRINLLERKVYYFGLTCLGPSRWATMLQFIL